VAALETPRVTPGWNAVDFHLKGTDEKVYTLADVRGPKGLLVMFICNHCPFLQAIASKLMRDTKGLAAFTLAAR
jgi:peroxiredoxin